MDERISDNLEWRPLYQQLKDLLLEHIRREDLWGKQLGSEQDLVDRFGVSRTTVRKALELLKQDGTLLSRQGRRTIVRPQESNHQQVERVAIVGTVAWESPTYYTHIIGGIVAASGAAHVALSSVLLRSGKELSALLERLDHDAFAGLLLVGMSERDLVGRIAHAARCPAVLVDHYFDDLPLSGVIDDGEDGLRQAVEHLAGLGHRRIAYVDASNPDLNPWKRKGYRDAIQAAGLPLDGRLIVPIEGGRTEAADERLAELLGSPDPVRAFVACDHLRARQVLRVAETLGRKPGRDFALVVCGHTFQFSDGPAGLTTVEFDLPAMGREGLRHLRALMFDQESPGQLIKIPNTLIVRSSSFPATRNRPARASARAGIPAPPGASAVC
jgi:DNA-binding LacI/PurR family transcriptional regulator